MKMTKVVDTESNSSDHDRGDDYKQTKDTVCKYLLITTVSPLRNLKFTQRVSNIRFDLMRGLAIKLEFPST